MLLQTGGLQPKILGEAGAIEWSGLGLALFFTLGMLTFNVFANECHRRIVDRAGDRKLAPSVLLSLAP